MKKIISFLLFFTFTLSLSQASHLVGGEFELKHLTGSEYELTLVLYFDYINGNPGALDQEVNVNIFNKLNDNFVETIVLPITGDEFVEFSVPGSCSDYDDIISTKRFTYSKIVTFSDLFYISTAGYYAVWERCCRNATLDNIKNPSLSGQAFYMEFSSVIVDEQSFINSSPVFTSQVNDFACVGRPFVLDYSATDEDGDSLVYSLTTPLNGFAREDDPAPVQPHSAPYPEVNFLSGYSSENMILGNPGLSFSSSGKLEITPIEKGLFAYAVKCEEFRDGIKIGEVRKEYQLLVINCPSFPEDIVAPSLRLDNGTGEDYIEGDTLIFEDDKLERINASITLFNDIQSDYDLEIVPIDHSRRVFKKQLLSKVHNQVNYDISPLFCIEEDEVYNFYLIAKDFQCPEAAFDTLTVTAKVKGVNIIKPEVSLQLSNGESYVEGNTLEFEFGDQECVNLKIFTERDQPDLKLEVLPLDFSEMHFTTSFQNATDTSLNYELCSSFAPNQEETVHFLVIAQDKICPGVSVADTLEVTARIKGFANDDPVLEVSESLSWDYIRSAYEIAVTAGDQLDFEIMVSDIDFNDFDVEMIPVNFNMAGLDMVMGQTTNIAPFSFPFTWNTKEEDLSSSSASRLFIMDFVFTESKFGFGELSQNTIRVIVELNSVIGGIESISNSKNLVLYPNPYGQQSDLILEFKELQLVNKEIRLSIKDLLGREIYNATKIISSDKISLNTKKIDLQQGIYLFTVELNSQLFSTRLFVK